jgi:hypothetical protein
VEKSGFTGAAVALYLKGRLATVVLGFSMVDFIFGVLFLWAFFTTPQEQKP